MTEPMTVWVLTEEFAYEGSDVLGVFSSREAAMGTARTALLEWQPDPTHDHPEAWSAGGSLWYRVCAYPVNPKRLDD